MVYYSVMQTESRPDGQVRSFIEEARRAQILVAAKEVLAEVGYAKASLARIAERAGTSKSVISYHFDGKEDLLHQVVSEFFVEAWAVMEKAIDAESSHAGKIRAWVGSEIAFFGSRRTEFLAMVEVITGHRSPDGSRPFAESTEEEIAGLAELLALGQEAGEFRQFDPRGMANIIIRSVDGVLGAWLMEEHDGLDTESAALLDFIDHGIRA